MIEVTRVNENREIQVIEFPDLEHMTVLDGALVLLSDDGQRMLAGYAPGEWIAVRLVDQTDG